MMYSFIEMVKYMRPEGSPEQKQFCQRFIEPIFGKPDFHGNYTHIVNKPNGDHPDISFMAHHDTVHKEGGIQNVWVEDDRVFSDGNCLGADCTTGVYLILSMIMAKVPGVYVIHAAEELGCIGSGELVKDHPLWIDLVHSAISFDRMGYDEIITHQAFGRTASDRFARELAGLLDLNYKPSEEGIYTDSNEYAHVIPECTNISVGYHNQHTSREWQSLGFLFKLEQQLINADWDKLEGYRTPEEPQDFDYYPYSGRTGFRSQFDSEEKDIYDFIHEHPQFIADYLSSYGITYDDLAEAYYQRSERLYVG